MSALFSLQEQHKLSVDTAKAFGYTFTSTHTKKLSEINMQEAAHKRSGGNEAITKTKTVNNANQAPLSGGTPSFYADPIAERALLNVSDVFPREWKALDDKVLAMEMRKLVNTVKNSNEAIPKRQKCLMALDNLAWHSKTKRRLLDKDIAALDLLCSLSFGDVDVKDIPLRSLALNTLNKMALSNTKALFKRGILRLLVNLAQQQMKLKPLDDAADDQRQKVLLCIANVFLTFANDRDFRSALALGGPNAAGENGVCALDLMLTFLNTTSFSLSLRGSAGMALMKLCEMCRPGEECWKVVRQKITETNTIKTLILLLLKDDEKQHAPSKESSNTKGTLLDEDAASCSENKQDKDDSTKRKRAFDEAAFTNKAIILDVLYAISNLDSFENEMEIGEMGEKIIKAGGCVVCCLLINKCIKEKESEEQSNEKDKDQNRIEGAKEDDTKPHQLIKVDLKTKAKVDIIRASVSLLSSMAFVEGNRKAIVLAKGIDALVTGILECGHDPHTISYGCRALYMLDKIQMEGSKNAIQQEEEVRFLQQGRERMEKYASELIPVLIEVIIASNPSAVKYPSNQAYMLRHICLLFFLFSSIPSILENLINDTRYKIVDVLCMLLDGTVMEIQVNTLAVVANFVETLDGARKICENKKLLQILESFGSGKVKNEHLRENASYAMAGLRQKVPEELEKMGIQFSKLAIKEKAQDTETEYKEEKKDNNNNEIQEENNNQTTHQQSEALLMVCGLCEKRAAKLGELMVCGRCRCVAYCSKEHQRLHWKTHKTHCKPCSSK